MMRQFQLQNNFCQSFLANAEIERKTLLCKSQLGNYGRDAFLVMSFAYYDRTCLWSADIFTSVWQENLLFL